MTRTEREGMEGIEGMGSDGKGREVPTYREEIRE